MITMSSLFLMACPNATVIAPEEDVATFQSERLSYVATVFSAAATTPAPGSIPVIVFPASSDRSAIESTAM